MKPEQVRELGESLDEGPTEAYLPLLTTAGKQAHINVTDILMIGELENNSLIITKSGMTIFSKTPYLELLAMVDEVGEVTDSYYLKFISRGALLVSKTAKQFEVENSIYGKLAGYQKGNSQIH